MSLVFADFSRGFRRGCLIHRHRQFVAIERAAVRRLFKGHAGLDLDLSSHVSVPWRVMQPKVWGGFPIGSWLIPCHQCQATPIEVHCFSPLLPTLCAPLAPFQLCDFQPTPFKLTCKVYSVFEMPWGRPPRLVRASGALLCVDSHPLAARCRRQLYLKSNRRDSSKPGERWRHELHD